MASPPDAETARQQLPDIARRLLQALPNLYDTPHQGRVLEAYIRHHIFTRLDIPSLPVEPTTQEALSALSRALVDDFVAGGRAEELGWALAGAPQRELEVRCVLQELIERYLVIPAKRVEWRDEWMAVLIAGASDEQEASSSSETAQGGSSGAEEEQSSLPRGDYHDKGEISGPAAAVANVKKGASDEESVVKRFGKAIGREAGSPYLLLQESMLTKFKEDHERKQQQALDDAEWAEEVKTRIDGELKRGTGHARALSDADESGDESRGFEEEDGEVEQGKEWKENEGDADILQESDGGANTNSASGAATSEMSPTELDEVVVQGMQGLGLQGERSGGGVRDSSCGDKDVEGHSKGIHTQPENGQRACAVCGRRFPDADALNEHYQKHLED